MGCEAYHRDMVEIMNFEEAAKVRWVGRKERRDKEWERERERERERLRKREKGGERDGEGAREREANPEGICSVHLDKSLLEELIGDCCVSSKEKFVHCIKQNLTCRMTRCETTRPQDGGAREEKRLTKIAARADTQ
jgi:hypothetical protein